MVFVLVELNETDMKTRTIIILSPFWTIKEFKIISYKKHIEMKPNLFLQF